MADFFASPRLADLILFVLLLEGIGIWSFRRRTGRGPEFGTVLPFLLSGAFLVLALRGVLAGASWLWIAGALLGALGAHLVDLAGRAKRG